MVAVSSAAGVGVVVPLHVLDDVVVEGADGRVARQVREHRAQVGGVERLDDGAALGVAAPALAGVEGGGVADAARLAAGEADVAPLDVVRGPADAGGRRARVE